MAPMWTRRAALKHSACAMGAWLVAPAAGAAPGASPSAPDSVLAKLEQQSGGRLGVGVIDTGTGQRYGYRDGERFPLCSTFKVLAVALTLSRVESGKEKLERRIPFATADLLEYAPVTRARVQEGSLTVAELCEAAVGVSDNTAANLLLASYGGPAALTAYARTLGDTKTRLDRNEPMLNEAIPGDERDTTTPAAMAATLQALLLGGALSKTSRERLTLWMAGSKTGLERLRAGVPATWRVADKTGSGLNGTTNDIAVLWPPDRAPLVITTYLTSTTASAEVRNGTHQGVARSVAARLGAPAHAG